MYVWFAPDIQSSWNLTNMLNFQLQLWHSSCVYIILKGFPTSGWTLTCSQMYEYLITFDQEVRYLKRCIPDHFSWLLIGWVRLVWPSRWSIIKFLFIFNRYLPFASSSIGLHRELQIHLMKTSWPHNCKLLLSLLVFITASGTSWNSCLPLSKHELTLMFWCRIARQFCTDSPVSFFHQHSLYSSLNLTQWRTQLYMQSAAVRFYLILFRGPTD